MKFFNLACIIALVLMTFSCQKEYMKYSDKPDYVTNPQAQYKSYFESYDAALQLWGVPFEELYIPTSVGIAHVIVSGPKNGEPLVLLHGMNATSTMWYPNAKAFSKDYRLFAIDFILEPGKSLNTATFDNVDEIASWYYEIFDKLELEQFSLIGASKGGWLSVKIALYNQERIKKMVLLSPAQTFIWIRPSMDLLKNIITMFSSDDKKTEQTLKSMSSNVDNINKIYLEQFYQSHTIDSISKFTMAMQPFSKRDLQSLKMPVLVLIGDDDAINNSKTVKMAKEILPYGQGEIIKNAGHFLSIDQADVVNQKTIQFLNIKNKK
ncbi:alpha/beta hydrolase [Bizionia argentinensis JUB59]|uniref:Alpha/beta hydrolase n=1 Tax=Bizionia argentinensis JUB59 TaxID=1046627 RepID=G2E9P5_9FLAO|nr:alpha/beta hydrolase [Bizionia argentinensis]EGV44976.1 alpha/beta hydrolase [Bizionia argentinensis JUB59]